MMILNPKKLPRRLLAGRLFCVALILGASAAFCSASASSGPQAQHALVELGARLFFEKHLSRDDSTSCATCHVPAIAYADHKAHAVGIGGRTGTRNAPSLVTAGLEQTLFWDGRRASLEAQVLDPIVNANEMGLPSIGDAVQRVHEISSYRSAVASAFGSDSFDEDRLRTALAAFIRSLAPATTSYERFENGSERTFSPSAQRGLRLFAGKAGCSSCHSMHARPARFSDGLFHHGGVSLSSEDTKQLSELVAQTDAMTSEEMGKVLTQNQHIASLGRYAVTRNPKDIGAFRTPSLLNVALTAPYMHDGSVATLEEAINVEIYYRSLSTGVVIDLTTSDRRDLAEFLRSLTTEIPSGNEVSELLPAG
jgi:cytochrome c peroxidase